MKTGELMEELKLVSSKIQIRATDPQYFMLVNYTFDSSHENLDNAMSQHGLYYELKIEDKKLFKLEGQYETAWYNGKTKYKLGKLVYAKFRMHAKD